jgi:hypothetical protein
LNNEVNFGVRNSKFIIRYYFDPLVRHNKKGSDAAEPFLLHVFIL